MADSDHPFVEAHLANGLRIVMEVMPQVHSAAAGFLVNTGSRDETPDLAGVSHFLEHMCFKGTARRNWRTINIAFDEMGSYYNAFTSKERTFYFGWVPAREIDSQIELLADMMQSVLPGEEFDVEKGVILEEIAMSKDSIEHTAWDLVHERLYPGHPLAWSVLGTEESVKALTRDRMYGYLRQRYSPGNIILVVTGRIDPDRIVAAAERVCGGWEPVEVDGERRPPTFSPGTAVQQVERFNQQAIGFAYPAPAAGHPDSEVVRAIASILGGDNSRFYWDIIQTGLALQAGVYWVAYADCGLLMLDGLCGPEKAEEFSRALEREAAKISRDGVVQTEVQRVKNRRRTGLAVEAEAAYHRLIEVVEDLCEFGRPRTVQERLAEVDAVTIDRIANYLREWPIQGEGFFLSLGPRRWPEGPSS
jgi:predicted Zn-dependent peptidase